MRTFFHFIEELISTFRSTAAKKFLTTYIPDVSWQTKVFLIIRFSYISCKIDCAHINSEMITIAQAILTTSKTIPGVIVEAGSYQGGSSAKLSIIAKMTNRKLAIFDSFQGIPKNKEIHNYIHSSDLYVVSRGMYKGNIQKVKQNIATYGELQLCSFHKGWFEETMPKFHEPIIAMFLDVDLAASTRTCLRYLYPLLQKNGVLFSHDGHLARAVEVYEDAHFWRHTVHCKKPNVRGLGKKKLLYIKKQ
jgi:O-methyltransferase